MANKAQLRWEIVRVQERINQISKLNKKRDSTTLAVLHDEGNVGEQWCQFIVSMFTEQLPEDYRDMNLDVLTEAVDAITEDEVSNVNNCEYKILLVSAQVLKYLRNGESHLRRSDILDNRPERLIVLILSSEDDVKFLQDANRCMIGFKDYEHFNIIRAKFPDQIFTDIMAILGPMYVIPHPNIMSSEDKEQHLTLISNKPFPVAQEIEYVVEMSCNKKTKETSASLFNPCTLLLQNPGHLPGVVTVKIFACTLNPHTDDKVQQVTRTQIGDEMKIWYQSDLDRVYSVLESQTNPIQFLCQAMKISNREGARMSTEEQLDQLLTKSFKKYVPDDKFSLVFGNDQSLGEDQDGNRSEYVPTLLHFSAMYGLRDLTACLLQCPGAVQAYGSANCDGDYPTHLAEKFGHWDLRDFMETYMEVSAMVDKELGDKTKLQTSQVMSSMVSGNYLSLEGPEGLYATLEDCSSENPITHPPGYVFMHPQKMPHSVDYDSMIHKMLEGSEEAYAMISLPSVPAPQPPPRDNNTTDLRPVLPPRDDKMSIRSDGDIVEDNDTILRLPRLPSTLSTAQQELISLQQKVKCGELTINQAVFRFKEWERKHKETAASFQYQQESLQRIRNSLIRSKEERRQKGDSTSIKITKPLIAGSSTYDRVLLKTREAVMEKTYGGIEQMRKQMKSGSVERKDHQTTSAHVYTAEPGMMNRVKSFKKSSFIRPPMTIPEDGHKSPSLRSSKSSTKSSGTLFSLPLQDIPGVSPNAFPYSTDLIPRIESLDRIPARASFSITNSPPPIPPRDDYGQRGGHGHHVRASVDYSASGYVPPPVIPPRNPVKYR